MAIRPGRSRDRVSESIPVRWRARRASAFSTPRSQSAPRGGAGSSRFSPKGTSDTTGGVSDFAELPRTDVLMEGNCENAPFQNVRLFEDISGERLFIVRPEGDGLNPVRLHGLHVGRRIGNQNREEHRADTGRKRRPYRLEIRLIAELIQKPLEIRAPPSGD